MSLRHGGLGMIDWRWHEEEVGPDLTSDPLALLRGCILRAIGWSVVVGVLVGVGYVVLPIFRYASAGSLITSVDIVGMMGAGAVPGAIIGLMVGIANGLVLAVVTLISFVRLRCYRAFFGIVSTVTTLLSLWVDRLVLGVPYVVPAAGPGHVIVALVLAGLGGWWVGDRLAQWYVTATLGWDRE